MNIRETFDAFILATEQARINPSSRPEMGKLLETSLNIAGKTKRELINSGISDRATVDRWLNGTSVPNRNKIHQLEQFLIASPEIQIRKSLHPLASLLLDNRFTPVIKFHLEELAAGRTLTKEELHDLLWLAEKSRSPVTIEFINILLGRSTELKE